MERRKNTKRFFELSSSDNEDEEYTKKAKKLKSESEFETGSPGNLKTKTSLKENAKKLAKLVEARKQKKKPVMEKKTRPKTKSLTNIPKIPKVKSTDSDNNTLEKKKLDKSKIMPEWQEYEILQTEHKISPKVAKNVLHLFNEGNTIPFIARYRRECIGNMTPDTLREVKNTFENIVELKRKIVSSYASIYETGKMTESLSKTLLNVKSIDTLKEVCAPYMPEDGKVSIKQQIYICLEECASEVLNGNLLSLSDFIDKAPTLKNVESVEKSLILVVAKKIATNTSVLQFINKKKTETNFTMHTKKVNKRIKDDDKFDQKKNGVLKFNDYYDRTFNTNYLKPHQIMAINRAEHLKYINVTLDFKDFYEEFLILLKNKWPSAFRSSNSAVCNIINLAADECYQSLILPLLKRIKRSELKSFAEKASLDVFSGNLKQLLLAPPVKGTKILGIDPGFSHGCKIALISETGSLLATSVIYPHDNDRSKLKNSENILRNILIDHNCSLIALGNGKACRETESWITELIKRKVFRPLDVSYTIVNESGASVYSCSKEAMKEFKKLDINRISAVSLARRVQEPLAELVKIDPKHLGIGMYQHDVNQKRLEDALTEVVSECVSFVGIDINTASQCILKYVAGLSDRKATEILQYREKNGPFKNREELLNVKGIGPHTFKQCAGFLKIPNGTQKLDSTIVHPETYDLAIEIVKFLGLSVSNIGEEKFISRISQEQPRIIQKFQAECKESSYLETVLEGLSKPFNYDLRCEGNSKPLFKQGITNISSLSVGMLLTGSVNNVTSFGYFIDIGVGSSGLLHSKMAKGVQLHIGEHVEVRVVNLELERQRIGLELMQKL